MMRRNLAELADREHDVLVVGGGASGAAVAREAALRGLKTALIERDDFGAGSSAHCFKVVHGGIRYLQHADVARLRASCNERAAFLKIAPHLVAPLPFVIPTYGWGRSSKWFLGTGMRVYDALSADRNRSLSDPSRRVPGTRFMSRAETLALAPFVPTEGLTGAAVFDDAQMYSPPRLVMALAAAAAERGAEVANYVGAESFLVDGERVVGVRASDRLGGARLEIRARIVINAAGPWAEGLLATLPGRSAVPAGTFSRDACFVIRRQLVPGRAIAIAGQTRDADAVIARATRHLFLVPWRDRTLVGVWHRVVPRDPDGVGIERAELRQFIAEFNASCPALGLTEDEVEMTGFGLVPFGEAARQGAGALSFGKESRLIDHRATDRLRGLISVISVRYTIARQDAAYALDLACEQLGVRATTQESRLAPVPGGDIESFPELLHAHQRRRPAWLRREAIEALTRNHGRRAADVLAAAERDPALQQVLTGSDVSLAEVDHVIRTEMAQRASDIVLRRTDLGTAGHPGDAALAELERFLAARHGWTDARLQADRAEIAAHYARYLPPADPARAG